MPVPYHVKYEKNYEYGSASAPAIISMEENIAPSSRAHIQLASATYTNRVLPDGLATVRLLVPWLIGTQLEQTSAISA